MQQLLKRHVNDSLRVLYNRFINPNTISPEELDALYDVCHAYRVVTEHPGMKYVLVIEKDGSIRQRVAYKPETGAKVYLYHKEARIVWESDNGRHYTDSIPYETKRLFYEMRYLELCENRRKEKDGREQEVTVSLSYDTLKQYGMDVFEQQEVFVYCSKRVRESIQEEDDFLLYLCFALMQEELYDHATLTYLAQFYCGATRDMKQVWQKARAYGVNTKAIAERIITQMLFSEVLFGEEEIFEDYYTGKPHFRLKQAYLAYAAKLYVVRNRVMSDAIIRMILQELSGEEYLADICKVAVLKRYAGVETDPAMQELLRTYFEEMNRKRLVFPFYLKYPVKWLKEAQLYDKVMVEYRGQIGGKVKIVYQVTGMQEEESAEHAEAILPVYDELYVKEFVLYEGEVLEYYFVEDTKEKHLESERGVCKKEQIVYEDGKYGRLNLISRLSKEKQYEAMLHYRKEEKVAEEIFPAF